ncbi:MAG: thiamine pyrophosphate-binding protein, partial [Comamonadaceae bacterium]
MTLQRPAGHALVEALRSQGTDLVFGVPGESFLAVLDGMYAHRAHMHFVTCRNESGAAFMAEAHGKLTGRPGVCMVTRGPGAANAMIGLHTAHQDSTPLLLLIGQVARGVTEREAFQELDYRRVFGPLAKWVAQVDDAARIPEFIARAYRTAMSGRPGPVVLALPEDMLAEMTSVPVDLPRIDPVNAAPAAVDVDRLFASLASASGRCADAVRDLASFARANRLPVACAFRFQDLFDNTDPLYAGDVGLGIQPKLAQRIRDADLLLAIGPRLGEASTGGYTLLDVPRPRQQLVHVHAGVEELGRVYQADLMINSGMPQIAAALAAHAPVDASAWADWRAGTQRDRAAWTERRAAPGALQLWDVLQALQQRLPDDAIVTNGAGNYTVWV